MEYSKRHATNIVHVNGLTYPATLIVHDEVIDDPNVVQIELEFDSRKIIHRDEYYFSALCKFERN